jgi:hypothetical protein
MNRKLPVSLRGLLLCCAAAYPASLSAGVIADPSSISGNILWLDGNDIDGDSVPDVGTNGSLLSTWTDKSGSGNSVSTTGGNPQQFFNISNGNSVVRFTDDLAKMDSLALNVASDYTLFTVVTPGVSAGGRHVLSGMLEDGTDAVLYTNAGWRFYSGPGGTDLQISAAAKSGTHIFGYQLDSTGLLGGDLGIFGDRDSFQEVGGLDWGGTGTLNGIRIGGINRGGAGDANVGNNEGWLGDIAEVLIYDRPLDGAERQIIANYLQTKWFAPPLPPDAPALPTAYTQAVLADGPLHYYRFEETHTGQPAKDAVGVAPDGDKPGTFSGGITAGQSSAHVNLGSAAYFDGTPGTLVDLGTPFHPASGVISIEAWVNLDQDAAATFLPIAARWDGSFELDVNNTGDATNGSGRVNLVSRSADTNEFGIAASSEPMPKGEWQHVVGTFDDGQLSIWLNGELVSQQTVTQPATLQDAGATLFIGSTRDGAAFNWKGSIDEVAFYDYALSQAQIRSHMAAAVPEPASSLGFLGALLALASRLRRRR